MHTDSSGGIAADRREQQQMRKNAVKNAVKNAGMIRIYLNMAWKLLQKNLLSIVIFETVYRLFSNQLVSRLANAAINFSLKQLGTSYMTSENFNKIMLHPLTLLLIFGILLVFFFCMLFEIYAVMAALEASWKRKRISVPVMMLAGGRGAAQFVRARPWTWFFYMAASFPYLWLHSSYSAIRSMKLLQVSLTKIFNAFPAYWIPVVLTILLVAFSFVFSYTIPFRCMMTEKEKNTHLRVRQTLEKRVLRELGINVSFQVMIFLITWVLYLIFGTAVVAYAKLVKTPSTVVSTVIVYGQIDDEPDRRSVRPCRKHYVSVSDFYPFLPKGLPEEPDNEKAELEAGTHLLWSGNGGGSHDRHAGGRNGLSCICHARNTCRGNGFLPVYFGVSAPGRSQKSTGKYDERDQICSGQHVGLRGDRCTGDE